MDKTKDEYLRNIEVYTERLKNLPDSQVEERLEVRRKLISEMQDFNSFLHFYFPLPETGRPNNDSLMDVSGWGRQQY